jgi:hypothetical protein
MSVETVGPSALALLPVFLIGGAAFVVSGFV